MIHKISELPGHCSECGESAISGGFTKINKDGFFCSSCLEIAQELEYEDNDQFGMGA